DRLRDRLAVGPIEPPSLGDGGDGGAVTAVERHDAELHAIAAEQACASGIVVSVGGGIHIQFPYLPNFPRCFLLSDRSDCRSRDPVIGPHSLDLEAEFINEVAEFDVVL